MVLKIRVTEKGGDDFVTTREHLHSPNNLDIGWIPLTVLEYRTAAKELSDKEINSITSPKHLAPLQQEFLILHHWLARYSGDPTSAVSTSVIRTLTAYTPKLVIHSDWGENTLLRLV